MEYTNYMKQVFGQLTKKKNNIIRVLNNDTMQIDYLFKNAQSELEKMSVIHAERQIALENLRKLTSELQTKRLRYKTKSSCKYFTL